MQPAALAANITSPRGSIGHNNFTSETWYGALLALPQLPTSPVNCEGYGGCCCEEATLSFSLYLILSICPRLSSVNWDTWWQHMAVWWRCSWNGCGRCRFVRYVYIHTPQVGVCVCVWYLNAFFCLQPLLVGHAWNIWLAWDDWQIHIVPVAICLMIFEARWNVLFVSKVKFPPAHLLVIYVGVLNYVDYWT